MTPDPRWLEILKASGWQTSAIAVGCAILIALRRWGVITLEPWMVIALVAALVFATCLASAAIAEAFIKAFPLHRWALHWFGRRREQRRVAEYIPYMTEHDREIISYLLAKKQKAFTCASDGGYATTLIANGVVTHAVRYGYEYSAEDIPMVVPDHVYEVLEENKEKFPYRPDRQDGVEVHPWRVPWQLR